MNREKDEQIFSISQSRDINENGLVVTETFTLYVFGKPVTVQREDLEALRNLLDTVLLGTVKYDSASSDKYQ